MPISNAAPGLSVPDTLSDAELLGPSNARKWQSPSTARAARSARTELLHLLIEHASLGTSAVATSAALLAVDCSPPRTSVRALPAVSSASPTLAASPRQLQAAAPTGRTCVAGPISGNPQRACTSSVCSTIARSPALNAVAVLIAMPSDLPVNLDHLGVKVTARSGKLSSVNRNGIREA